MTIFANLMAFITSIIMFIFPALDYSPKAPEDIKLNVALISDVHIDSRLPCGKILLGNAFVDVNSNSAETDVLVVAGDLTNYGEEQGIIDFFEILTEKSEAGLNVVAMGNHDIGHVEDLGFTNQEARDWFLKHHNEYLGTDFDKNYYSYVKDGYKFIVLCDESEDNWDEFEIYEQQVAFLDKELADGAKEGLPVFVICHEPLVGQNGQEIVHDGGCMDPESSAMIKPVLEKYKNVFFISGHMHEGINGDLTEKVMGFRNIETENGVTYVSLPSYLLLNRYGYPWNGLGMQMEVYEDSVLFRARSYMCSYWYSGYEYEVELVK